MKVTRANKCGHVQNDFSKALYKLYRFHDNAGEEKETILFCEIRLEKGERLDESNVNHTSKRHGSLERTRRNG